MKYQRNAVEKLHVILKMVARFKWNVNLSYFQMIDYIITKLNMITLISFLFIYLKMF